MNIKRKMGKIFSIQDYGETHNLVYIFGIKIKFPKSKFRKIINESIYIQYKKNNVDITTLPPATGQVREIQLANFALLKELDYVCKENNLNYWIAFGSLIGAIRHKGFVPWDDDIDTGMLRQDYEKIIEAFNKSSRNPDIFADYYRDEKVQGQYIIKVQHRKCKHLFVDIFPFDVYGKSMTLEEQFDKSVKIKALAKNLKHSMRSDMTDAEVKTIANKTMSEKIIQKEIPQNLEECDLVWGIEFYHGWKNWFTHYSTIFPLKTINFEGQEFPCPNDSDSWLKNIYGNYMGYPNKIGVGHNMYLQFSEEEKNVIKDLSNSMESK